MPAAKRRRPAQFRFIVTSSSTVKIWQNGVPIYENAVVAGKHRFGNTVLLAARAREQRPADSSARLCAAVGGGFDFDLKYTALPTVVATLPEKLGLGTLAERLKEATGAGQAVEIPAAFLAVDWSQAARSGDAAAAQAVRRRCSRLREMPCDRPGAGVRRRAEPGRGGQAFYAGPPGRIGAFAEQADRAGVSPRKLETAAGQVETGLVIGETSDRLELLLSSGTRKAFAKSDIVERHPSEISAMPAGLVKTPDELRDLLAYMLSENPQVP